MTLGSVSLFRAVTTFAFGAISLVGCETSPDFRPAGDVGELPTEFRWPADRGADAYVVRVFAPDGTVVFESRRLTKNELPVRGELAKKLTELGRFTWRVRIYDGDRIAGRSDPLEVALAAPRRRD